MVPSRTAPRGRSPVVEADALVGNDRPGLALHLAPGSSSTKVRSSATTSPPDRRGGRRPRPCRVAGAPRRRRSGWKLTSAPASRSTNRTSPDCSSQTTPSPCVEHDVGGPGSVTGGTPPSVMPAPPAATYPQPWCRPRSPWPPGRLVPATVRRVGSTACQAGLSGGRRRLRPRLARRRRAAPPGSITTVARRVRPRGGPARSGRAEPVGPAIRRGVELQSWHTRRPRPVEREPAGGFDRSRTNPFQPRSPGRRAATPAPWAAGRAHVTANSTRPAGP